MSREMMEQREQSNACINSAESRKNKSEAQMRHSGIDWIGEIPKEWEVVRLKNLGEFQNGLTYSPIDMCDENGVLVIRSSNIKDSKLVFDDNVFVNDAPSSLMVQKGDIIICSRNGSADLVGKCAMVENNLNASFGAFMVRFRSVIDNYFSFYLIQTAIPQYKVLFTTTTINQLTKSMLSTMIGVLPSISEQQKIANYLDKVCGEVDEMIALQEQMIEELKAYKQSVITEAVTKGLNPNVPMKDSGIDWIGEVPVHWEICRIKNIASLYGRIGFRGYTSDDLNKDGEGAIALSPSNMTPMGMDYSKVTYLSWRKYEESPEIMIQNDDLLMVKTGSSYGKVSYVDKLPRESTINPQILRVVPSVNSKFLGYYMQTNLFIYQVEGGVVGGTIPTISQEKINNFYVILPNDAEQLSIASYLDTKCAEIDDLIAIKQSKIEELKEYKKSVIYEYVTGKKEVV